MAGRQEEKAAVERSVPWADEIELADGGVAGLPPVHLWSPTHCGDIGLEIRRDGSWWRSGSRINRERLVKLFARILRKDDDGRYYLVTPHEKVIVHVDAAPFTAVRLDVLGHGGSRRLRFTTNLGDAVDAGSDRPIRVGADAKTGEPTPFVLVRAQLEALLTRSVFFDLVQLAEPVFTGDGWELIVSSRDTAFSLGRVPGDAL
jgi:hypothetical protein